MQGSIVLCAALSTPTCQLCAGSNYNVACHGSAGGVEISRVGAAPDGSVTVAFFVPAQTFAAAADQGQRYIFATGAFTGGFPQQHATSGSSAVGVNLATGKMSGGTTSNLWGWLVGGGIVVLWLAIGWAVRDRYGASRHAMILKMLMSLSLLGGIAAVIVAEKASRVAKGDAEPISLAFGVGGGAVFIFLLLPVAKHAGLARFVANTPFDRVMWAHPLLGVVIIALIGVHMVGMWMSRGTDQILGDFGNLAGVLSWVLMVVMAAFGFLRGVTSYKLFKYTHMLFILAIGLAVIHFATLAIMLAPSVLLYVVDWILRYRRIAGQTAAGASGVRMKHIGGADAVVLEVPVPEWAVAPPAGSYAFVSVPEISWMPHPFTVAGFESDKRIATFVVKVCGPWTQELGKLAQSSGLPRAAVVRVDGPYGSLQTPLERHEAVVLIAGGVGVTPMLRMLQLLAENPIQYPKLARVYFVWSLRTAALHTALDAQLTRHASMLRARGISVRVQIFLTSGATGTVGNRSNMRSVADDEDVTLEMLLLPLEERETERPSGAHRWTSPSAEVSHHRMDARKLLQVVKLEERSSSESAGVYICAPKGVVDVATSAVVEVMPSSEIHTEPFNF